jgi:peptidoglycan-associated lipoprotein
MRKIVTGLAGISVLIVACAKKPILKAEPKPENAAPAPAVSAQPEPPREYSKARIQSLISEVFKPVYFPFDRADLSPEAVRILSEAAGLMAKEPSIEVMIQGNTDDRGASEYNLALGEKRARAVRDYLVAYGIAPGRLQTISYGEERPARAGDDETAWAANRRDEFLVTF